MTKKRKKHRVRNILLSVIAVGIVGGLFLLYGPWNGFRNYWITTAMTTMHHQYLATWLYSDKTIEKVLSQNKVIENTEQIDTSLIEIYDKETITNVYKDEYDRQVLEHNPDDIYKYFKVEGYNFDAHMAVIYDPSKISVVHTKYMGYNGQ